MRIDGQRLVTLARTAKTSRFYYKADFVRKSLYWMAGRIELETYEEEIPPTYLRDLYASEGRQTLVDYFLSLKWSDYRRPLSKKDIVDQTGVQRKTVIEHIDILVELGIVNEVEGSRWTKYEPAVEKEPYQIVLEANLTLGEYYRSNQR